MTCGSYTVYTTIVLDHKQYKGDEESVYYISASFALAVFIACYRYYV